MEDSTDLETLVVLSQQGDNKSYDKFLRQIAPIVRNIVHRKWWGNPLYKEDIIQDIIIAIHSSIHTYDPNRPLLSWLKTIAIYEISNFSRRNSKDKHISKYDFTHDEENAFLQYEDDDFNKKEAAKLINEAINTLPPKQAKIVRMIKIYGLSVKETAEQLEISPSNVKAIAHRSYKKMGVFVESQQSPKPLN